MALWRNSTNACGGWPSVRLGFQQQRVQPGRLVGRADSGWRLHQGRVRQHRPQRPQSQLRAMGHSLAPRSPISTITRAAARPRRYRQQTS